MNHPAIVFAYVCVCVSVVCVRWERYLDGVACLKTEMPAPGAMQMQMMQSMEKKAAHHIREEEGRKERVGTVVVASLALFLSMHQDSDYRITLSPLGLFFPDQLINLVLSKPTCIHPDTPVCDNHFPVDFRFPLSSVSLFFPIPHTPPLLSFCFSLFCLFFRSGYACDAARAHITRGKKGT